MQQEKLEELAETKKKFKHHFEEERKKSKEQEYAVEREKHLRKMWTYYTKQKEQDEKERDDSDWKPKRLNYLVGSLYINQLIVGDCNNMLNENSQEGI